MSSAYPSGSPPKWGLSRSQLAAIIIATLAISLVVDFSRKAVDSYRVKARAAQLQAMVKAARAENERLEGLKEFAGTSAFIEQEARRNLKMGRPGEVRVVFLTPEGRPEKGVLTSTLAISPTMVPQSGGAYWQAWWRLFFDGEPPGGSLP